MGDFLQLFLLALLAVLQNIGEGNRAFREMNSVDNSNRSPLLSAGFASRITGTWVTALMLSGWRRTLDKDELWQPLDEHRVKLHADRLESAWEADKDSAR